MLGREELRRLAVLRQALVAESELNRLALRQDIEQLRSAASWFGEASRASRGLSPVLLLVAPLAGFLVTKLSRRAGAWASRIAGTASWILPLYRVWKSVAARRKAASEARDPQG